MVAVAYLLTWTTYGTWLHGDARGSVDRRHNVVGHPVLETDANRRLHANRRMAEDAFRLSPDGREIVKRAVEQVAKVRGWKVAALHVGAVHVHVVLDGMEVSPEVAVKSLKSWSTRALRQQGMIDDRTHVWTKRASTRYLNTDASKASAVDYVLRFQ